MMETLKNWFQDRFSNGKSTPQDLRRTSSFQVARARRPVTKTPEPAAEVVKIETDLHGRIESLGPGKNVLIRNRFVREETGTHESLKILDDSVVDSGEATGIDPYNTGGFDRSKNWDQRFRK